MTEQEEREQFYKDIQVTPQVQIEGETVEFFNNGRIIKVTNDWGVICMDSYAYYKMLHEGMKKIANDPNYKFGEK